MSSDERRATWVVRPTGQKPVRQVSSYTVRVLSGPDAGVTRSVLQPHFTVGAYEGNDLKLNDPAVSGHHFDIRADDDGLRLRDRGSKNGTLLGTVRIIEALLPRKCRVIVGGTELELTLGDDAVAVPSSAKDSLGPLVGQSVVMRELFAQIESMAATDATVLIGGETGTGKEGVAEALVQLGPRAQRPLVVVDCGSLTPTLVESTLFGHEKGAFTGATERHEGAFERAHTGTVFLDEIGELPLELQPRLLRVLERREVQRVGGKGPVAIDVRVIAATHRDLATEVNQGRFRADLYYRLGVLKLQVPPLRERLEDLPLLTRHFAGRALDEQSLKRLSQHDWPGNVRELKNAVERWLAGVAPLDAPAVPSSGPAPFLKASLSESFLVQKERLVDAFEKAYAAELLQASGGNLSEAGRRAGLTRMGVVKMLTRHGLLPR